MAFCKQCGAQIPDGAPFCGNCGAAQGSGGQTAPAPQQPQVYTQQYEAQPGGQNSRKGLIIGLVCGGVALTAGLVVLILFLTGVLGGGHVLDGEGMVNSNSSNTVNSAATSADSAASATSAETPAQGETTVLEYDYFRVTVPIEWKEHIKDIVDGVSPHGPWYDALFISAKDTNACTLVLKCNGDHQINSVIGNRDMEMLGVLTIPTGYPLYLVADTEHLRGTADGDWIYEHRQELYDGIEAANGSKWEPGVSYTGAPLVDYSDIRGTWVSRENDSIYLNIESFGLYYFDNIDEEILLEEGYLVRQEDGSFRMYLYGDSGKQAEVTLRKTPEGNLTVTENEFTSTYIAADAYDASEDVGEAPANYEEVLARFASALGGEEVSLGIGHDDPLNYGASCIIMELAHGQYAGGTDGPVGYVLKDLDGDGTPELLIGRNSKVYPMKDGGMEGKDAAEIIAIYTIEGNRSVPVMFGWTRSCYYFREDNTLIHFGSMGAGESYGSNQKYEKGSISQYGYGISCHGGSYYALPENGDFSDLSMSIDDATYIDWHDSYLTNVVTLPFQALP